MIAVALSAVVVAALVLFGPGAADETEVATVGEETDADATAHDDDPPDVRHRGSIVVEALEVRSRTSDLPDLRLPDIDNPDCTSAEEYSDVRLGTTITVYDGNSDPVGTAEITSVEWTDLREQLDEGVPGVGGAPPVPASTTVSGSCRLAFSVPDLPRSDFYAIEVGERGKLPYSATYLESRDWTVQLVLA